MFIFFVFDKETKLDKLRSFLVGRSVFALFLFYLSVFTSCEKLAPNKKPDKVLCWALVWPCASEKLVSQAPFLSNCFFVAVSTCRERFMTFPRSGHEETEIPVAGTKRMS
jgi:hypothetical protein